MSEAESCTDGISREDLYVDGRALSAVKKCLSSREKRV